MTPTTPLRTMALALAGTLAASAFASDAISRKAGCAKGVGPSYQEIAAKYKGDAKAADLLAQRVRKGSAGVWGQVPMAATPPDRLSDADLKAVVAWILER
ncbi:MAG: cytochrome C [Burkholderiaceae bacterium]|nr:cytochrome C [Burkholderiaceae bacterium]